MVIDLRDLFLGLQNQLAGSLEVDRQHMPHALTKGDASELDWLGMLRRYLPSRYQIEKAFVLDADGKLSEQQDIVIFDRHYCPLLLNHNRAIYVPAESVYAVFEVKQTLDKEYIQYAGEKVASVRALRRTSVAIPHAGGRYDPKPPFRVLSGILSLDSDWNPPFGNPFISALSALPEQHQLDLGCSLLHAGFEVTYLPNVPPRIEMSDKETSLVFFFLRLLHRLQQLGTVPAIDLLAYSKKL